MAKGHKGEEDEGKEQGELIQLLALVEDLADVTLIDEDTKSIIPSNMRMQVAPPGGKISY